jgi:hypothetical protein
MTRAIGLAAAAAAIVLVAGPRVGAQGFVPNQSTGAQPRIGACFYMDADYRGDFFCVNVGENQQGLERKFNDEISSIRVFGPVEVVAFEDANFAGASRSFTADTPNLGDFNDRISSFQVLRASKYRGGQAGGYGGGAYQSQTGQPQYGACFYVDSDFRGDSFCLNSGESLGSLGDRFNDRISSIRLFGGVQVVAYKDARFGGAVRTILQDASSLGDFGGQISSVLVAGGQQGPTDFGGQYGAVAPVSYPANGACFFTGADYQGDGFCMNAGEAQVSLDSRYKARIASVRVFGGARAYVYEGEDYTGLNQVVSRDTPDLGDMRSRISSVRVK